MDDFHYSTDSEWDNADAAEQGAARPDVAWIVTNRDVIHANPFYQGSPVPHPYDAEQEFYAEMEEKENNAQLDAMEAAGGPVHFTFSHEFDDDMPW